MSLLTPFLTRGARCALLDGGFGTALGDAQADVLWGAQTLMSEGGRKQISAVHRSFLEAGSDIIGTNTYKLSAELLDNVDFWNTHECAPRDHLDAASKAAFVDAHLRRGVELASAARDAFVAGGGSGRRPKPLVAASVGPVGDSVGFTGMTDPDTAVTGTQEAAVYQYYEKKLRSLHAAGPDLFALETVPGLGEAAAAVSALEAISPDAKCWVSFISFDGKTTIDGCDFGAAVAARDSVVAVGVNCVKPALVPQLLATARAHTDKPLSAYPNSGEIWDARAGHRCWHGTEHDDLAVLDGTDAVRFRDAGAGLVGGCCRVTAAQIAQFREALGEY